MILARSSIATKSVQRALTSSHTCQPRLQFRARSKSAVSSQYLPSHLLQCACYQRQTAAVMDNHIDIKHQRITVIPHSNIPAACTVHTRSLSLLQGAYSEGSRETATAPTNSHRALLRRRHGSSLNCAALAPVAGSNQSCTADVLASRTASVPLRLLFLQQHSERWARERGTCNAHPVALCSVMRVMTITGRVKRVTRETGLRLQSRRQGVAMSRADGR